VSLTPADALALAARLVFVLLLYVFVAAVLLSLRRTLYATSSGAEENAPAVRHPTRGVLTLADGDPNDGPLGRNVTLDRTITLGRRPDCDVILRDDAVSGHHARIAWDGNAWMIEDLKSRNGTYVNGERAARPTPLHAGDAIRIGNGTWYLEINAS
jgi:hypothetical protein